MAQPKRQLSLRFREPRARKTDPKTSHQAAAKVDHVSIRQKILDLLELSWKVNQDGLTTFELAAGLSRGRDIISPHLKPLEKLGRVRRAEYTRDNPDTHCKSTVWMVIL